MKGQPNRRTARNIIGARVAKARMDKNPPLSQESLSEMLDNSGTAISRSMIAKIETGGRCVYDYEAVALARALNVDVRWLLGGRS